MLPADSWPIEKTTKPTHNQHIPSRKHMQKIVLILSSGGARGLAQIGVIEELERRGYKIVAVAGSSIGALIGGFYAAGKLQEFKHWVMELDKIDVMKYFDVTLSSRGFIKGDKIFKELSKILGNHDIEDLPIRYKALAADILSHKPVWFDKGSLSVAMRSSVSIPGVFTPNEIDGKMLVDGAIANPMPLNAFDLEPDEKLFAVNLNAHIPYETPAITKNDEHERERLAKLFHQWKENAKKAFGNGKTKTTRKPGLYGVLFRSFEMMQECYTMELVHRYQPDLLVQLSRESADTFEFNKAAELIAYGQRQASEAIENYEKN